MAKSKDAPLAVSLRVRFWANGHATAWLLNRDGPASKGLLYGVVNSVKAERLIAWAEALGIPVEREATEWSLPAGAEVVEPKEAKDAT